jgi:cold shock CspA family protein
VVITDTGTEVWVHYSHLQRGLRSLRPGQTVEIEWEPVVNQDGYEARAVHVRRSG